MPTQRDTRVRSKDGTYPWWRPYPKKIKLGVAYNVFDGEELLEASIKSIRNCVDYICVVYQETSNFGMKCSDTLMASLTALHAQGLADELVLYTPRSFSFSEKKKLISSKATGLDLGGATPATISDTFFNELTKREIGRNACEKRGCTHFMPMDTDEFYHEKDLSKVKLLVQNRGYECVLAKMRYFFKFPECELLPLDETNYVSVLFEIKPQMPFRLSVPDPYMIDPTRKLENCRLLYVCPREELVMYHYSFVRKSIESKLMNVSNRNNYIKTQEFIRKFHSWTPSDAPIHPHPYFSKLYQKVAIVDNFFDIGFNNFTPGTT